MTILSTKAGVKSRDADFLEFETVTGNSDSMGRQPYGSVTITQLSRGVDYANVQSAIEDVHAFSIRPVNSIEINTDGISPEGVSQVDQWEFDGTVTDLNLQAGDELIINVFGFPVKALVGDTAEEFAAKVKSVLQDAVTAGRVINTVETSASSAAILNISYADNQPHELVGVSLKGITIVPTTLSPSKPGYGAWIRIGTKTETLDGAAQPVLLHYFKRMA